MGSFERYLILKSFSQPYRKRMMSQSADDEPKKDPTAEAGIKVINNRRARIGEQILYKKIFFKIL